MTKLWVWYCARQMLEQRPTFMFPMGRIKETHSSLQSIKLDIVTLSHRGEMNQDDMCINIFYWVFGLCRSGSSAHFSTSSEESPIWASVQFRWLVVLFQPISKSILGPSKPFVSYNHVTRINNGNPGFDIQTPLQRYKHTLDNPYDVAKSFRTRK